SPNQDAIYRQVLAELESQGWSEDTLSRGGYTITTTIDPDAQKAAEQAVEDVLAGQPDNIKTSLVAVDPNTGGVRAYHAGNEQIGDLDYAAQPQEPGSSFKPFVVATGLKAGYGIGEVYDGSAPREIAGTVFDNAPGSACEVPTHCGIREALNESVNTVFVEMAVKFGPHNVAKLAHQAGIPEKYGDTPTLQSPNGNVDAGIALGMYPVRPIDMAGAYAAFANDGKRIKPHFVEKLTDPNGEESMVHVPQPEPAFSDDPEESRDIAENVVQALLGVVDRSKLTLDGNRPVAAKTGTHQYFDTKMNKNAWMIGATPQLSAAVAMLAEEDSKPVPLKEASGKIVYGSGLPGKVWQEFMNAYHQGLKIEKFDLHKKIGQFEYVPPPPPSTESSQPPSSSMPPSESSTRPSDPSESRDEDEEEEEEEQERPQCGLFGCTGVEQPNRGNGQEDPMLTGERQREN